MNRATDFDLVSAQIATLGIVHGRALSADRIGAYFAVLEDLPLAHVLAALREASREFDRFPSPGQVHRLAVRLARMAPTETPPPPAAERAREHPTDVVAWCRAFGIDVTPELLDDGTMARLRSAIEESATCGRRDTCVRGTCAEQVPIPRLLDRSVYGAEGLTTVYRPCPEHPARCEWRAARRVPEPKFGRRGETAA